MPPLDLKITRGLSLFDCQDHHAILGVPINAETKVIRRRYLKIARRLHPDSVAEGVNKETASMVLSKLVNPSYEFLSQPNQMDEYNILLRLVGQRYAQEQHRFKLSSPAAKEVLQATQPDKVYHSRIDELSNNQFSSLDRYLEVTETLSEINLAYLYRLEGAPAMARSSQASATPPPSAPSQNNSAQGARQTSTPPATSMSGESPPPPSSKTTMSRESGGTVNYDLVNQYYRRAEDLIAKACYLEAVRELKEVVEGNNPIDPNNSRVYTLLGNIYKDHMKQPVMARPFYTKALRSDPSNDKARQKLAEMAPSAPKQSKPPVKGKAAETDKKKFGFLNFLSRKK